VEDDAVSRKLSSKFLQVFGCTIDVAVDGVGAVNKMNFEKYDLVLMVTFFLHLLPRLLSSAFPLYYRIS
jgi:osomolarity two-component system response regulator SKN7